MTVTGRPDRAGSTSEQEGAAWRGSLVGELRWHAEAGRLLVDPVWRGADVPRGRGEAVVVVPGLLAGDRSTLLLRRWLRRINYRPHKAGMTLNVDCSERAMNSLEQLVERIATTGGQPITLIGHSRGGILGRALATRRPDLLERVVALGSGLDDGYDISPALEAGVKVIRQFHRLTTDREAKHGCMTQECRCSFGVASRSPFPDGVEMVSIYSRQDGFSHWRSSRVPYAVNIEVTGTHLGLVTNRKAYRALGFALAGKAAEVAT